MICHKRKIIFIHVPKCAGSSINEFYFDTSGLDWKTPDYERLYGWCPKRKLHLQHATSKELLETNLISQTQWETYFKFTFVRNPWDRSYSDYLWIMKDRGIKGSFYDFINQSGPFHKVLNDNSTKEYRGDHLRPQTDYFLIKGRYSLDYIGRFENIENDIKVINKKIGVNNLFTIHKKKNTNKLSHYSLFYSKTKKKLVERKYKNDIIQLKYTFEDKKKGILSIKKIL